MTPKMRANLLYYAGIAAMLPPIVFLGPGIANDNGVLTAVGALSVIAFVVLAGASLAASRCPHCRRLINLAGPSAFCPRCGKWNGLHEDSQPPRGG